MYTILGPNIKAFTYGLFEFEIALCNSLNLFKVKNNILKMFQ